MTDLARTRARQDRRSRGRETLLLVALAGALYLDGAIAGETGVGLDSVPAVLLAVVPLWWRFRAPTLVLATTFVATFACLLTLDPHHTVVVPGMVAVYAFTKQTDRRRAIAAGVLGVMLAAAGVVVFAAGADDALDIVLLNCVLVALAAATGDAARAREAFRASVRERERERERELRAQSRQLVIEERLRIAREVHDVVAHAIMAINVQAGTAAHRAERDPEQARAVLDAIKRSSGEALHDLRAALGALRHDVAPAAPAVGLAGLDDLVAMLRAGGVETSLEVTGPSDGVPAPIQATVFRIVQEASTNIMRHSGARHAAVRVSIEGSSVSVLVEDAGGEAPRVPHRAGSGNGVRGMVERAALIGGTLEARPLPDRGWQVQATLPL